MTSNCESVLEGLIHHGLKSDEEFRKRFLVDFLGLQGDPVNNFQRVRRQVPTQPSGRVRDLVLDIRGGEVEIELKVDAELTEGQMRDMTNINFCLAPASYFEAHPEFMPQHKVTWRQFDERVLRQLSAGQTRHLFAGLLPYVGEDPPRLACDSLDSYLLSPTENPNAEICNFWLTNLAHCVENQLNQLGPQQWKSGQMSRLAGWPRYRAVSINVNCFQLAYIFDDLRPHSKNTAGPGLWMICHDDFFVDHPQVPDIVATQFGAT